MFARTLQESSWDPPPEWLESPPTWGADYCGGNHVDETDGGYGYIGWPATTGGDAGNDGENAYHRPAQENPSMSAASSSGISLMHSPSDIGQPGGGGGGGGGDGDGDGDGGGDDSTGIQPVDSSTLGRDSQSSTERQAQVARSSGGGGDGASSGSGIGSGESSGTSYLDRTSADEFSQWSLDKLQEVSKVNEKRRFRFAMFCSRNVWTPILPFTGGVVHPSLRAKRWLGNLQRQRCWLD